MSFQVYCNANVTFITEMSLSLWSSVFKINVENWFILRILDLSSLRPSWSYNVRRIFAHLEQVCLICFCIIWNNSIIARAFIVIYHDCSESLTKSKSSTYWLLAITTTLPTLIGTIYHNTEHINWWDLSQHCTY